MMMSVKIKIEDCFSISHSKLLKNFYHLSPHTALYAGSLPYPPSLIFMEYLHYTYQDLAPSPPQIPSLKIIPAHHSFISTHEFSIPPASLPITIAVLEPLHYQPSVFYYTQLPYDHNIIDMGYLY
jgi:hypothetical protein